MTPQIDFEPVGRRVQVEGHSTLLDAGHRIVLADESGLNAPCGGQGWCGRCRVRVVDGAVSEPTPAERRRLTEAELAAGHRLACQARTLGPVRVETPPESSPAGSSCRSRACRSR